MITHRQFAFDAVTELAVYDRDCIVYWNVSFLTDAVWFKVTKRCIIGLFILFLLF